MRKSKALVPTMSKAKKRKLAQRNLLAYTLLIGTSAVLLRYWIGIYQYETVPIYEPNSTIRGLETALWGGTLLFGALMFVSQVKRMPR